MTTHSSSRLATHRRSKGRVATAVGFLNPILLTWNWCSDRNWWSNICKESSPFSQTTKFPIWSNLTPVGKENNLFPLLSCLMHSIKWPWSSNTCKRWLCVSDITIRRCSLSYAAPCGNWNWPNFFPGPPKHVALIPSSLTINTSFRSTSVTIARLSSVMVIPCGASNNPWPKNKEHV